MSQRTRVTFRPALERVEDRALTAGITAAAVMATLHHVPHHHVPHHTQAPRLGHSQGGGGGGGGALPQAGVVTRYVALTPSSPGPSSCFTLQDNVGNYGMFQWVPGTTQYFYTTGSYFTIYINGQGLQVPTTSVSQSSVPNFGIYYNSNTGNAYLSQLNTVRWQAYSLKC